MWVLISIKSLLVSWKGRWTWQTAWPGEWPRQSQRRESDQGRSVFSSGSVWNGYIYVYKYIHIYIYIYTHVSPMLLSGWSSNGPWLRKVWVITRGFIPRICPRERRAQALQVERWGTGNPWCTDVLGRCQTISSLGNFGIFVMEASLFLVSSKFWTLSHGVGFVGKWGILFQLIANNGDVYEKP